MNITALLHRFANYFSSNIRTCIPAQVISFDASNLTVNVQVAIQGIRVSKTGTRRQLETGEIVFAEDYDLSPILSVPVSMMWWNNYGITLPIAAGNLGTLIVCDRDISVFKKLQKVSPQPSLRKFDLNDSIFLPFLPKKASISEYSSNSIDVRFGSTKLKVSASGVDITGNLTVSGTSTLTGGATINGTPFASHKHPYLNGSTPSTTGTPTT